MPYAICHLHIAYDSFDIHEPRMPASIMTQNLSKIGLH
jgi:hypothetical protein